MSKNAKLYEHAFLTGCDYRTEWMLPWFIDNFRLYNPEVPLVFANFGVSKKTYKYIKNESHAIINLEKEMGMGWFLKPLSMLNCPSKYTCWIDTDCEVLDGLDGIWDHVEPLKLTMVEDKPWSRRSGEVWHNSGVVAFYNKPPILNAWWNAVKQSPKVGDQEILHQILDPLRRLTYIKDLPNEYNWLRLQLENDGQDNLEKKVMHWTGEKGKNRIRKKISDLEEEMLKHA
tara:strand:- start:51 stop:740 length:690 start_codon:yes stop_codon:yes gene_type:complete